MKSKLILNFSIFLAACCSLMINNAMAEVSDTEVLANATQQWNQISSNGFTNVEQAKNIMSSFESDKALSKQLKDKGAEQSLQKFNSYLDNTKKQLESKFTKDIKIKQNIAKRWDMVSQQALDAGSNVNAGMVNIFKQTVNIDPLVKELGIYTQISSNDPVATKKAKEFAKQIKAIEAVGVKMGAVESAVTPRDSYTGSDKAEITQKIRKQWAAEYPKDEILALRFVDEKWGGRNEYRYNNVSGRYKVHFSSLEVKVLVKKDKHVAIIYPVSLMKDHLKGDNLEINISEGKNNAAFTSEILLKNLKL